MLLDRRFETHSPTSVGACDTTEVYAGEGGRLFFAAILELHSTFVVGWALSATTSTFALSYPSTL